MTAPLELGARALLSGCALLGVGCSTAAPRLEGPSPSASVSASTAPPIPSERWVSALERPAIGPPRPEGTIAVVGGRRALLHADGTASWERQETGGPLDDAVIVPTSAGVVLVARQGDELVRFDDPLGAPTPLLRTGPASQIVGTQFGGVLIDHPHRLIEVPSGAVRRPDVFSPLELKGIAFLDELRGTAWFDNAGAWTTRDGARTWDRIDLQSNDIRATFGGIECFHSPGSMFVAPHGCGFQAAKEGPLTAVWGASTGIDPLVAAARYGIPGPGRTAYVAYVGKLAKVDLATGRVLGMLDLGSSNMPFCDVTWLPDGQLLAACSRSAFLPGEGVMTTVALEGDEMRVVSKTPVYVQGETVVSRDGGLLFMSPCGAPSEQAVCVRQPDGTTASVPIPGGRSDALPRADGTIVYAAMAGADVVVGTSSVKGVIELARTKLQGSRELMLIDASPAPRVAVVTDEGTYFGDVRGAKLELARALEPVKMQTRGGAFLGVGKSALFVHGPDGGAPQALDLGPGVYGVSAVGFSVGRHAHLGFGDALPVPYRAPPDPLRKSEKPIGQLVCKTKSETEREETSIEDELKRAVAQGKSTVVDTNYSGAAAIEVAKSGAVTEWKLRWVSATTWTQDSATLVAPAEGTPHIVHFDVYRGTLALVVDVGRRYWVIGATHGKATSVDEPAYVDEVTAGDDGSIAWIADGLRLRAPGGDVSHVLLEQPPGRRISSPAASGVLLLSLTGSALLTSTTSPRSLSPSLYAESPSVRGIDAALEGGSRSCAPDTAGRAMKGALYPIQLTVDGRTTRKPVSGWIDVPLEPAPCVGEVRADAVVAGRYASIRVDLIGGRATLIHKRAVIDLECSWGPVAENPSVEEPSTD